MKPWDKFAEQTSIQTPPLTDVTSDIKPASVSLPPALPPPIQQTTRPYTPYQSNQYQSNQYQGYGQYNQGYGQYNQSYGMYNQGYQGYGGQGMGQYQPQNIGQGTQQAFFVLEQLVQTISGFSQMLDSTFHATQSSFMAMVALSEQFGVMRQFLASTLKHILDPIRRILGKVPESDKGDRSSRLPILLFLLATFGLPFLMSRLLKLLESKQVSDLPVNLVFAQALFDFNSSSNGELSFAKGDVVGVLEKCLEPWHATVETAWWRGRLQNGAVGIFPANYVKLIDTT